MKKIADPKKQIEVAFEDKDGFVLDVTEDLTYRGGLYAPDWQYQEEELSPSSTQQIGVGLGTPSGGLTSVWQPGFFDYKPVCPEGTKRESDR